MPAAWGVNGDGTTGRDAGTGPDAPVLNAVARLAEIPGISPDLARSVIAETGLDMTRFPTAAHLVSWAGLCPSARQSGTRTRAGKKGQGDTWLRGALGQAAIGAARTATFLGERDHRIAAAAARPRPRSPSPAPSWSSSGTCSLTRRPVHRPRPRLLPGPHRHRPEDQKPHPADRSAARPPHHHHAQGRLTHTVLDQARRPHQARVSSHAASYGWYFPVSAPRSRPGRAVAHTPMDQFCAHRTDVPHLFLIAAGECGWAARGRWQWR